MTGKENETTLSVCSNCEHHEEVMAFFPSNFKERIEYVVVKFCPKCADEENLCTLSKKAQKWFKKKNYNTEKRLEAKKK